MKLRQRTCLHVLSTLALLAAVLLSSCATREDHSLQLPRPEALRQMEPESAQDRRFWQALRQAQVIYISEIHDDDTHHQFQFDVMQGMNRQGLEFAVGWEMFEVPQQPLLDKWQQQQMTTDELLERVNWQQRWGVFSNMYEEMLRWTRENNVNNVALNAPGTLARKIARGQPLTDAERAMIPGGYQIPAGGLEAFMDTMTAHPMVRRGNIANFYRAQLLWEQTMADRILQFLAENPGTRLIVLLGRGHVREPGGVPYFVRQKGRPSQIVLNPGEEEESPTQIVEQHRNRSRLSAAARP